MSPAFLPPSATDHVSPGHGPHPVGFEVPRERTRHDPHDVETPLRTPVPRPKIQLLNGRRVADEYPHLLEVAREGGDAVTDVVARAFRLGNGSVYVEDESVKEPFAFISQVGGRRAHVVVARTYAELAYRAYLHHVRSTATNEWLASIRATYSPWLRMALATPLPGTDEDEDDFQ